MRNHPLRAALSEEMHLRRLPRFAAPCRLAQVVTLLGEAGDEARAHLEGLAAEASVTVAVSGRYAVLGFDEAMLVWERHTEFASYTLMRAGPFGDPFDPDHFAPLLDRVLAAMPGEVVRATQIALCPADAAELGQLDRWFAEDAQIVCDVADGLARIASDFRISDERWGRLLVVDRGLARDEVPLLMVRLQELGNYRNMALLGLPLAQRLTPEVSALEARLAALTREVAERGAEDDALLDELTFLSAELARLAAATRYRMSATRAYAQLSSDRLDGLGIGAVRGYQSLADFTERRLTPAVRTCESFAARLEDLSQRVAWTSEVLRTRIDIALAKQNRDLLGSVDRRARLQLRLQQTVEGLSVVAISYYLVGLIGYFARGVSGPYYEAATAAAVPVTILVVAVALRRLRHGAVAHDEAK